MGHDHDHNHPKYLFRLLNGFNVEVHRDGLAVTSAQHALEGLGGAGVDFLVRDIRGHVNKVTGSGLCGEL